MKVMNAVHYLAKAKKSVTLRHQTTIKASDVYECCICIKIGGMLLCSKLILIEIFVGKGEEGEIGGTWEWVKETRVVIDLNLMRSL